MDESWAEQKWQKFNSSHVKVADLRKVCTLLQFVLKIENLNRICIMARTKYIYIQKIIAVFFSVSTTNATLFVKVWFVIFHHFASIFSIQLK